MKMGLRVLGLLCAKSLLAQAQYIPYDDFHYPTEEVEQSKSSTVPTVASVQGKKAEVRAGAATKTVSVGDKIKDKLGSWTVKAILSDTVVFEQDFERWGLLALACVGCSDMSLRKSGLLLRKSIGTINTIRQPRFNFSKIDSNYWSKVEKGQNDFPSQLAMNHTADGEISYSSVAATLAPQRDYASISNPADAAKFVVTFNGKVKCASLEGQNGITEYVDLHAPAPNAQTVVFDPAAKLQYWPKQKTWDHSKMGWVGGHLHIANVGATSDTKGYAMIVFAPVTAQSKMFRDAYDSNAACAYSGPFADTYVAGNDHVAKTSFSSLGAAKAACDGEIGCNGITELGGLYTMRDGAVTKPSPKKETSWLVTNASKASCRSVPRLPGINYSPGTMVRLTELGDGNATSDTFFYAANSTNTTTTTTAIGAEQFYEELLKHVQFYARVTDPAKVMSVSLPASDQRQADMSYNALLTTMSNYVGNQSNYGNGMTYWSYGREDNGSLPLNILSVDDALLDWGFCDQALGHIGFYLDNYVEGPPAATQYLINYYTWGGKGDSVSDYGRLVELYLKAVRYCTDGASSTWGAQYLPKAVMMGELLLSLRRGAASGSGWQCVRFSDQQEKEIHAKKLTQEAACADDRGVFTSGDNAMYPGCGSCWCCRKAGVPTPAPPGVAGLLQGPPEHDFSSTTDKYFYNNNVWSVRGMEALGAHLSTGGSGGSAINATLGGELLAEAKKFRADIDVSVKTCAVPVAGAGLFLPPFAEVGAKPFASMTESRDSSYANFRFFSEVLLADFMPRDIEASMLAYHNHKGGRMGGASRFEQWMDDMPTAGWGYGALSNNQTADFQALLYGHMATYQSRGTFHSTEQLSFEGEGMYRSFLHWPNPNAGSEHSEHAPSAAAAEVKASNRGMSVKDGSGYYANENDVSYCIVSNILVARLTRWQLVFEDYYRTAASDEPSAVWLARGAPARWFAPTAGGFEVKNVPTRTGRVSYTVAVPEKGTAVFDVRIGGTTNRADSLRKAGPLSWRVRVPGKLSGTPVCLAGCKITAADAAEGAVAVSETQAADAVHANARTFKVSIKFL